MTLAVSDPYMIGIASILVFGILAQWLAWRVGLPSILLLLIAGFIAGPALGVLNPDELLGNLLLPIVSVSVAIILFEGGLGLKISDLSGMRRALWNLITLGALITWVLSALAAWLLLKLDFTMAILFGGILVVTGPTVIIPLLRFIHPNPRVGSILKWEGILIDPIGALLVVLIFEVILQTSINQATQLLFLGVMKTLVFGSLAGLTAAGVVYMVLKRYWMPDHLHNPITLMMVIAAYIASNYFQEESGLFAVTIMGIALANQSQVNIQHIIDFKEDLVVLLISSLFVILAARINPDELYEVGISIIPFMIILILVIRPLSVFVSTWKSDLTWNEKAFISWMAPRGIVAAAVASIFSLRLEEAGFTQGNLLVPYTFLVIIGTVLVYGLTSKPVAKWLNVSQANPQGVLFMGAHQWLREMAKVLKEADVPVLLVDSNRRNVYKARLEGLPAYHGSVFSNYLLLDGLGRLLAMSPNDEANSLATLHYLNIFGRSEVHQLRPDYEEKNQNTVAAPKHLRGRYLFGDRVTFDYLDQRIASGSTFKKTKITEEFSFEDFKALYGENTIPLFLVGPGNKLQIFNTDNPLFPTSGQTIISLIESDVPPKTIKKKAEIERKKEEKSESGNKG